MYCQECKKTDLNCECGEAAESSNSVSNDLLSSLWPFFLKWIADYAGDPETAEKAIYSREDMRHAYKSGFERAVDYVELVDRPTVGHEIAKRLRNI